MLRGVSVILLNQITKFSTLGHWPQSLRIATFLTSSTLIHDNITQQDFVDKIMVLKIGPWAKLDLHPVPSFYRFWAFLLDQIGT